MPPKRGNAKKAEAVESEVVGDMDADVATKKKGVKAVKVAEEKASDEVLNGDGEHVKNGGAKRGRKAKENGNGVAKNDVETEITSESPKSDEEPKAPGKRGRKPKDAVAEKPPAVKKTKASEDDAEPEVNAEDPLQAADQEETEAPKSKRGRKPAEKKQAEPKTKITKAKKGKVVEVEEPADEEEAVEPEAEEEELEVKPAAKKGRGVSKKAAPKEGSDSEEVAEKITGKKRGAPKAKNEPAAKKKAPEKKALLNKASTDYSDSDFNCTKTTSTGDLWNFKISSWNVDGIRAWANKGGLEYIEHEKPDILCLQETKCSRDKLPSEVSTLSGYHPYWLSGEAEGYAGVGIYTKKMPISVVYGLEDPSLDDEGRIITAEYEQFYLICTYVPNAGRGLVTLPKRLKWNEAFKKFVKALDAKKPVIICGDMNVSHNEIDLARPKSNTKNAGFTKEERDGMTELLGQGFVDTFRSLYPDKTEAYTFWTYMMNCRAKNIGWRLDYALVSERLMPCVCENVIRSKVFGSDHCPITLFLHVKGLQNVAQQEN